MLRNILTLNKYKNQDKTQDFHEEHQYLNICSDILKEGELIQGRNGFTKVTIGGVMHFSLQEGSIPLLTTKKMAWKTCLKELLWFIRGKMDNHILKEQNVHIWDGNTTPEFKKEYGVEHLGEDDLGPVYGHQWRFFNADYVNKNYNYDGQGVDQLQEVIDQLKDPKKRNSRRLIISAWNPCQIQEGVLPPCHVLFQFHVTDENKLSCTLYQRSVDVFLGCPFNIASYSFLTHLIAHHCDLIPHEFIHYLGNTHIYDDHFEQVEEQIKREPHPFPKIKILCKKENINDYTIEDFQVESYVSHKSIKGKMRS